MCEGKCLGACRPDVVFGGTRPKDAVSFGQAAAMLISHLYHEMALSYCECTPLHGESTQTCVHAILAIFSAIELPHQTCQRPTLSPGAVPPCTALTWLRFDSGQGRARAQAVPYVWRCGRATWTCGRICRRCADHSMSLARQCLRPRVRRLQRRGPPRD